MAQPKRATILGDVIGSRQAGDRELLQIQLRRTLELVNDRLHPTQPMAVTIGDEFQGAFSDLGQALAAALRLHLLLHETVDLRLGLGWGELYFGDDRTPYDQDGPCWWRAREALEWIEEHDRSNMFPRSRRTAVRTGEPIDEMLDDYLTLRDQVVSGIDAIDARIALGLLEGSTLTEMAEEMQMNKSSVSRRAQSHGLLALITALPREIPLGLS